jgi:predicted ribosome quality control (RQC) complex YloA/Tae2 family protein
MDKMKVKYGKNAAENWRIYEVADEEDMWFHVDDDPSAHVILEDPYTCEDEAFHVCARLCVERTPKLRERDNVKVIYTKIGNLKKGKCIGELMIQNMDLVKSLNVKKDKMGKRIVT